MSIGVILFVCLIVLLLGGIPIAACIGGAAVVAMLAADLPLLNFASKVYASVNSFTLMAIPFFMLAGSLMATGGMSQAADPAGQRASGLDYRRTDSRDDPGLCLFRRSVWLRAGYLRGHRRDDDSGNGEEGVPTGVLRRRAMRGGNDWPDYSRPAFPWWCMPSVQAYLLVRFLPEALFLALFLPSPDDSSPAGI